MRAHRLSVALVAVTATALSTISPVTAGAESSSKSEQSSSSQDKSGSSSENSTVPTTTAKPAQTTTDPSAAPTAAPTTSEKPKTPEEIEEEKCRAEINKAYQEHKKAAEEGNAGSSFIGPKELALGVINGYGSSGMPDLPQCAVKKDPKTGEVKKEPTKFPEWAQSAAPSDEMDEAFEWITMILTVLGGLVQAFLILAKVNPQMLDPIRDMLKGVGVKF